MNTLCTIILSFDFYFPTAASSIRFYLKELNYIICNSYTVLLQYLKFMDDVISFYSIRRYIITVYHTEHTYVEIRDILNIDTQSFIEAYRCKIHMYICNMRAHLPSWLLNFPPTFSGSSISPVSSQ